mgnify:FL=1
MTPARRHRERVLAALQGAANPQFDQARANAYELQLMQLAEHRRTLKGIQSIERKIDAKRTMLGVYKPWIDGLLAADRGGQDDVLVTVMLWHLDTGDLEGALPMASYVIRHGLTTPDRYERTAATLIACLATYALRNVRWKGLAIPASFPPVIANALIVGAFEITVFFSDSAPTATMAVFNAVAVGVGEIISCCVLGVALVKLIESNESLNKIFAE